MNETMMLAMNCVAFATRGKTRDASEHAHTLAEGSIGVKLNYRFAIKRAQYPFLQDHSMCADMCVAEFSISRYSRGIWNSALG